MILMTGSVLVILENITKLFNPQPVNDEGILWLGIIAVTINMLASLVVRKGKTKNESILSLHFLEDTLGWVAVILMATQPKVSSRKCRLRMDSFFVFPLRTTRLASTLMLTAMIPSQRIPSSLTACG